MGDLPLTGIGTPILALLAMLSLLSITLIVVKAVQMARLSRGGDRRARALEALGTTGAEPALAALGAAETPADRVAATGFEEVAAKRFAGLQTVLETQGNAEARGCYRYIRTLETIAMISPLLGLLGTVLGMIQAFRDLEIAGGAANAALLAGGIWQALLTTAAGLLVALPAAAGAALLASRADAAVAEIEGTIGRILAAMAERTAK